MANAHSSYLFTSESVTEGHPDKVCDQISDAVLDAILAKEIELAGQGYVSPSGQPADPTQVRCACETMATTGMIIVAGEIRTQAYVDVPAHCARGAARDRLRPSEVRLRLRYLRRAQRHPRPEPRHRPGRRRKLRGPARPGGRRPLRDGRRRRPGHDVRLCLRRDVHAHAHAHLPGTAHGRAAWPPCARTARMPYLRPDGKTQVSVRYVDGKPVNVEKVVVSTQHAEEVSTEQLRAEHRGNVIRPVLDARGRGACRRRRASTSTPPAASSSAAPWATAA